MQLVLGLLRQSVPRSACTPAHVQTCPPIIVSCSTSHRLVDLSLSSTQAFTTGRSTFLVQSPSVAHRHFSRLRIPTRSRRFPPALSCLPHKHKLKARSRHVAEQLHRPLCLLPPHLLPSIKLRANQARHRRRLLRSTNLALAPGMAVATAQEAR